MTRRPSLGDLLRRLEALPLGPLWLTLGLWVGLLLLFVAWCAAFGALDRLSVPGSGLQLTANARTQAVITLLIAFLFSARRFAAAGSASWAPLRPLTRLDADTFERLVAARSGSHSPVYDAMGALLGMGVLFLSSAESELRWNALLVWGLGANAVLFVMMLRAARGSLAGRQRSERIAQALVDLDLLDTSPLDCFGRQGLRQAFFWVGGSSIAALLALDLDHFWPTLVILVGTLALASLALLGPARAAARRIASAKADELALVRQRIRAARQSLVSGGAPGATLPGLLAYERRIGEVREWPFDTPTLLRFGALALLATGSWLGGALVERLLDAALG